MLANPLYTAEWGNTVTEEQDAQVHMPAEIRQQAIKLSFNFDFTCATEQCP